MGVDVILPPSFIMFKFGQKLNPKIEELIKILPFRGKVLDIGAGMGTNSIFLAERGFNVTCMDSNKEVIEVIKKTHPNINAVNQNVLDFEFKKNEYDLILAINVLNFFKLDDIKNIINNIIESLKKNGLIYLQIFSINDQSYNKFLELAEKSGGQNTFYSRKTQSFTHFFNKQELIDFFDKNTIIDIEELIIKDNHPPNGEHEHGIIRALIGFGSTDQ